MSNFAIFIAVWLALWFAGLAFEDIAPDYSVSIGMVGGYIACWVARALDDSRGKKQEGVE